MTRNSELTPVSSGGTLSVDEVAQAFGISRGSAYDSIRRGDFPVEPIYVGRRIRIPREPLNGCSTEPLRGTSRMIRFGQQTQLSQVQHIQAILEALRMWGSLMRMPTCPARRARKHSLPYRWARRHHSLA